MSFSLIHSQVPATLFPFVLISFSRSVSRSVRNRAFRQALAFSSSKASISAWLGGCQISGQRRMEEMDRRTLGILSICVVYRAEIDACEYLCTVLSGYIANELAR